jgi:potassium-transporting ATPase KdpC subunit
MKKLFSELWRSILATLAFVIICCCIYPLLIWMLSNGFFHSKAKGSMIVKEGTIVGSALIGQNFTDPRYFHPRPSAAGSSGYDATHSGGSNLGPTSQELMTTVKARVDAYRLENGLDANFKIPADAVTASASGLDPHISLKNALLQAPRVAKARTIREAEVLRKIEDLREGRSLGIFGEQRINVLKLNLALDKQ